jgi:hypothetical protein
MTVPGIRRVMVSGAIALSVLVAGCGGAASTGSSQRAGFTAAQLCALVTQSEMSATLGSQVGAGVASGVNAPSCTWSGPTPKNAGATIAGESASDVDGSIPFGLQGLQNPKVEPVKGLGDAAYLASANGLPNADLSMRKGSNGIEVTVAWVGISQGEQIAAEEAIAKAAAGRM